MLKNDFIRGAVEQMQEHLAMPGWSVREKIALSAHILHAHGHGSGLAGQISARFDDSSHFFTQRMGQGFDEVTVSELLLVDEDLRVLDGCGMPNPANRFHAWIYREHPDVNCIVHTHPLYISALSMLGCPLEVAHMDSCALFDDISYLPSWPGVPIGDGEGEIISRALGTKRAVLLAHHGLLVACRNVQEACVVALQCERAARLQLLVMGSGECQQIDPRSGMEAHDWLLQDNRVQATFYYHARKVLRQTPSLLM